MGLWLKNYEVKGIYQFSWPLISPYSIRHFASVGDDISGWKKAAHCIVGLLEVIPILGQIASGCEWVAHYFFDRRVTVDESKESKNNSNIAAQKLGMNTSNPLEYSAELKVGMEFSGLVGDPEKCRPYLLDFTDENDNEIPLSQEDVLIPLVIQGEIPKELRSYRNTNFYLPYGFLEGKENIKLKYNGNIISLKLIGTPGRGTFDEYCKKHQEYVYGQNRGAHFVGCGNLKGEEAHKMLLESGRTAPKGHREVYSYDSDFNEVPFELSFFEGAPSNFVGQGEFTENKFEMDVDIPEFDQKNLNFYLKSGYLVIRYKDLNIHERHNAVPVLEEDLPKNLPSGFERKLNIQYQFYIKLNELFKKEIPLEEAAEKIKKMHWENKGNGKILISIPLE